jgi:hypothetical protein
MYALKSNRKAANVVGVEVDVLKNAARDMHDTNRGAPEARQNQVGRCRTFLRSLPTSPTCAVEAFSTSIL